MDRNVSRREMLGMSVTIGDRLVTEAAVFHEFLHRYSALHRAYAIRAAFNTLHGVTNDVSVVELTNVERAKAAMLTVPSLSARKAAHAAVMQRRGVCRVISFDAGLHACPRS